jgi:ferric-dicitrate binding protein FerR (iron transport regulator)
MAGGVDAELGRRLWEAAPAARPAFARSLEERFLAPQPAGAEQASHRRPAHRPRPWRLLPVAAALAVAAALLLWSSLTGPASALRFEPVRAQGARYAGAPLEQPFVARAGQLLEVGEDPLRLKLGDALRLFLAGGSQVEIELPCALRGGCLEACLALEAEREAVVVADEREHRVEVTLETAQARVVLFGAEASVKPCADGTCIVIQSGRARVEPHGGPPVEVSAGQRLFVGGDGRIDLDPDYLKRAPDPAVVERVGNLRRSLAEVAEGVF